MPRAIGEYGDHLVKGNNVTAPDVTKLLEQVCRHFGAEDKLKAGVLEAAANCAVKLSMRVPPCKGQCVELLQRLAPRSQLFLPR